MSDLSGRPFDGSDEAEAPLDDAALEGRTRKRVEELLAREPELRNAIRSPEATEALKACPTSIELVAKAFELYADRPLLSERVYEIAEEGPDAGRVCLLPEFRAYRFADIWKRVAAFASGLQHEKLAGPGSFVGICGFGSVDWVVSDVACLHLAAVSVPLQSSMSAAELQQIIRDAELSCIVCSRELAETIFALLPQCPSVRSVVIMDSREGARAAGTMIVPPEHVNVSLRRMEEVEESGRKNGILPITLPSVRGEPDPLMSLNYTSGSTGLPKGAMMPESLLRKMWSRGTWGNAEGLTAIVPQVMVSYMPLSHAAGRWGVMSTIATGGRTSFVAKSDMSTLFEDIQIIRPTSIFLVPRVAEMIYQRYLAEVGRRAREEANDAERQQVADTVMREMRSTILGDRLLMAMIGSAPTPPAVEAFLKRCLEIPIYDGYGSTEAGMLTSDHRVQNGVTFRLVDVPDLGYRTTDQPYPRGELHVKTSMLIPGYYKNETATQALFDEQGFMNTGDIVEQRGPDTLVWIDRAKNVLKLSQGEFVATSRLEALFGSRSPYIHQVYLYGNGARAYLLAVLVPDLEAARRHLSASGVVPNDAAVKNLLRSELLRIAREEELHGYEVPRDFIVEDKPFTVGRGLLTASNKPARAKLRAFYGPRLEAMYTQLEQARLEELFGLRGRGGEVSTVDKVKKAIAATVGLADADIGLDQSFIQLGGDSLAAVGLEELLEETCDVTIPVGFLLDPTRTVRALAEQIDRAKSAQATQAPRVIRFEVVHGTNRDRIVATDVTIEKLLDPSVIAAAKARPRTPLPERARVALLTGANGCLGRFMALDLLERLQGDTTRLYAVVRAPNDRAAFERFAASFQTDAELAARFAKASGGGRLVVLAGDLMKPRLGLTDSAYARIAAEVDLIVHNGALVNHALGYTQLFEPNVVGTARILELALDGREKSIGYVSTIGVLRSGELREEDDIRTALPEWRIDEGYAAGYGASKWASEILLRDAHDKLGITVSVFRPTEIMAHSRYAEQINVPDFFTRLVAGLVYTGIAPRSFYAPGTPDAAKHYDGLPVESVAGAISSVSATRLRSGESTERAPTFETFHVNNSNYDDGISLDVIVAWIRSGGYLVERIPDYEAWYRAFRHRLSLLGEAQRQHSPLVILQAWARPQGTDRPVENPRLVERLREVEPALATLPHVSEALIHKYLDDLVRLEIIDPVPTPSSTSAAG